MPCSTQNIEITLKNNTITFWWIDWRISYGNGVSPVSILSLKVLSRYSSQSTVSILCSFSWQNFMAKLLNLQKSKTIGVSCIQCFIKWKLLFTTSVKVKPRSWLFRFFIHPQISPATTQNRKTQPEVLLINSYSGNTASSALTLRKQTTGYWTVIVNNWSLKSFSFQWT